MMFSFPPILDGNAGVKLSNNADSGFPKPIIGETFYSIKDGNWSDTTVWQTASGRVGLLPGENDNVYIRNTLIGPTVSYINNLYVTLNGVINGGGSGIVILGSIQCLGTYNYSGILYLGGVNNYIDKSKQTACTIRYFGATNQPIIDANYNILGITLSITTPLGNKITCSGEKYLTCDLTVASFDSLNQGIVSWVNFKGFNFTCNGTFNTTNSISVYCDGNGYLLFKGITTLAGGFYCLNSPTIEFQNNVTLGGGNYANWTLPYASIAPISSYLGTGIIKFTTNNLTVLGSPGLVYDAQLQIADTITATFTGTHTLYNTINGLGATAKLLMGASGILNFATAASVPSMTTGIWDFTTNANTIQYNGNYSATIPSYFNTFRNLTIGGTGIKTLGVNTVLTGNLSVGSGTSFVGNLELSTYNLTVTGTTTFGTIGNGATRESGKLSKSGAGSVLFTGTVTGPDMAGQTPIGGSWVDFTVGNPNVELRGGLACVSNNFNTFKTGTGTWNFTTANQNINTNGSFQFDGSVVIASGITLGIDNFNLGTGQVNFNNTVNGASGTSRLVNIRSTSIIAFISQVAAQNSMSVGVLDVTTLLGFTVQYAGNYSATIPSYLPLFHNLTISGTGTKTLGVNTTVNGNLTLTNNGNFDNSVYSLTVNGTTLSTNGATLRNTGGGNILFVGFVSISNGIVDTGYLNFSVGNPNVEVRGGIKFDRNYNEITYCGTGVWTFSTNNQTIFTRGITYMNNIVISGAITLTNTTTTSLIISSLNGNNASSKFLQGAGSIVSFANGSTPMTTGVFDCTTNANTVTYLGGSSYSIPSAISTFRSLSISGASGTISLATNTTLNGNLTIQTGAVTFDTSTYTLLVNGTTLVTNSATFANTGGGAITFVGNVNFSIYNSGTDTSYINFSGNPNVEVRNGISFSRGYGATYNCGTGTWTFSTNNQNLFVTSMYGASTAVFNNIVISGAITLTNTSGGFIQINGSLNGDNASSTFTQGASTTLNYRATSQPMATGILNTSTNLNTWIYGSGNQNVKGGASLVAKQVYRNLTLNGGGVKTLQGYVSVQNTYTLTAPATLALNGFTLTNP